MNRRGFLGWLGRAAVAVAAGPIVWKALPKEPAKWRGVMFSTNPPPGTPHWIGTDFGAEDVDGWGHIEVAVRPGETVAVRSYTDAFGRSVIDSHRTYQVETSKMLAKRVDELVLRDIHRGA